MSASSKRLIRLITAVVAALASCSFVSLYSMACSLSYRPNYPIFTGWVLGNARYAYALPILTLISGLWLLRKGEAKDVALECLVSVLWLCAFVWVLAAIYAW